MEINSKSDPGFPKKKSLEKSSESGEQPTPPMGLVKQVDKKDPGYQLFHEENSNSLFLSRLNEAASKGEIPEKLKPILESFHDIFSIELKKHGLNPTAYEENFLTYLKLIIEQVASPFEFEPYHQQVRFPFDYYRFGIAFIEVLVDKGNSSVLGEDHLHEISSHINKNHNVILLANHQIEADPQAISILLEKLAPKLAEEMIFVAGERVLTDPLAVPFSLGRNLLCIYSKRYIDNPPEEKLKKQLHNKRTMELMSQLLKKGGKCIYIAPSGGRDRPNEKGVIEVAPFDPSSVAMCYLMAKRAKTPTFFFTLALATHSLLPPPNAIQIEIGETRIAKRGDIHLAIGPQIDMEHFPGSDGLTKQELRKKRAHYIWNLVKQDYSRIS